MSPLLALVDAGPLVAYYNKTDSYHTQICDYFQSCTFQLVTTDPCLAETMYLLRESHQVQSSLARDVAEGIWRREPLYQVGWNDHSIMEGAISRLYVATCPNGSL